MGAFKLKSRQWIVDEYDRIIIGDGRKEILEHIERTGAINKAAKIMKMSYKGMWSKIKSTEKHLKLKIVHSDKRAGTRLTREGKTLLDQYKRMHAACCRADDRIFHRVFKSDLN